MLKNASRGDCGDCAYYDSFQSQTRHETSWVMDLPGQ